MTIRSVVVASFLGLLLSPPCLGVESLEGPGGPQMSGVQDRGGLVQTRQGLDEIRAGRYTEASRLFNAALKFEPENASLHFLNGLAYHLLYGQGHQADRDLAETAYNLALRLAPDHVPAAYQLGMLHLESRQYVKAEAALAQALLLDRDNPAALRAMVMAAYYARDLGMALWAMGRVEQTQETSPDTLRTAAIVYAAAGRDDDALKRTARFRDLAGADAAGSLTRRVQQWLTYHRDNDGKLIRAASQTVPLTPDALSAPPAEAPVPPASAGENATAKAGNEVLRNWTDCPQGTPQQSTGSMTTPAYTSDNSPFKDETTALPPLPSPCDRRSLPRMALLDTAIVSTVENITSSKGINLLDGLKLFMKADFTDTSDKAGRVKTITRNATLGSITKDGSPTMLAYSLNIANAGNDWNHVLARPTLVALDRQPSTFFSGTSMSMVVKTTFGDGSLVDRPAGISLSVTPTFIDDETVLLAVRVARSFFIDDGDGDAATLTTSRNSVTTNVMMKIGETLILSGLTERQTNESKNGVPLLKEIPVVQYLFSTENKSNFTQSVLVMITPRKPVAGANTPLANAEAISDPGQKSSLAELRQEAAKTLQPVPNLDTVFLSLENNRLFREFRSGDLRADDWRRPSWLERTFKELADFLYY